MDAAAPAAAAPPPPPAEGGAQLPPLRFVDPCNALEWWPGPRDEFFEPGAAGAPPLRRRLHAAADGAVLPCRGRDRFHDHRAAPGTGACTAACREAHTEWDYGVLVKRGARLYFLYESGDVEDFLIDAVDFERLVHPALARAGAPGGAAPPRGGGDPCGVVVLAHGWSEEVGPNYPLVRTLEHVARRRGWRVVVPDFRETYRYGAVRGRAERVRVLYEELLCLRPAARPVVFVGHSQGGAAAAHACTPRVCDALDVRGLLMLGSENPLSMDGMDWRPPVPHLRIVHAAGDRVIYASDIRRVAERWRVPLTELASSVEAGATDADGDDIHHEFLARDLMLGVVGIASALLDACRDGGGAPHPAA